MTVLDAKLVAAAALRAGDQSAPNGIRITRDRLAALQSLAARASGSLPITPGGSISRPERDALDFLVQGGFLSGTDAEQFLVQAYPGEQWQGPTGDLDTLEAGERAERAALAGADPLGIADLARSYDPRLSTAAGDLAVHMEEMPEEYTASEVKEVVQAVVDQINASLSAVNVQLGGSQTVNGRVLQIGSVPASALDAKDLAAQVRAFPGDDEFARVKLTRSTSMDRFVGGVGPGRIWRCQELEYSEGYRVTAGPQRYRVVGPDMTFGVMSCSMTPNSDLTITGLTSWMVRWGIVIQGIPHNLGRPPSGVLAALAVGEQPVSLASDFDDGGSPGRFPSPQVLFEEKAQARFTGTTYPYVATKGTDANLYPSTDAIERNPGFGFTLITGRDSEEVFTQLNSLDGMGRRIVNENLGPTKSTPEGLTVEPPAPASVLVWDGVGAGSGPEFEHKTEADDLSVETRLVQGIPFRYTDCARLVPSETEFSLVVMPLMQNVLSMSGTWASPTVWPDHGFTTVGTSPRDWALDLVVW